MDVECGGGGEGAIYEGVQRVLFVKRGCCVWRGGGGCNVWSGRRECCVKGGGVEDDFCRVGRKCVLCRGGKRCVFYVAVLNRGGEDAA